MVRWRVTVAFLLFTLVGVPVALPFLELWGSPQGWGAWLETERLVSLAGNTLGLVSGTLALTLPAGIAGAVLLYRTDLPFRRGLRFLTILTLFVPLPLLVSAWQAALGTGGWLPVAVWSTPAPGDPDIAPSGPTWKPWAHGLGAAIWVHAVAGVPWVIVLVGQGLCWVERELEEDALTVAGPWRVLWGVTLRRCRATIFAAGLWVALMAATEITVTDMMQVRTFAEEVYTQFVAGDREMLARAVAVSLPLVAATWVVVIGAARRWEQTLPPILESQFLGEGERAPLFRLGPARWLCLVGVLGTVGVLAGIPLVSLIWKTGLGGTPPIWSAAIAGKHLRTVFQIRGWLVFESIGLAITAGVLTAGLGVIVCWLAVASRWLRVGTLSLMALVFALPGPVVGLGLKAAIAHLLDLTDSPRPLAVALYDGPSLLPALWIDLIRFFPFAVILLWPVLRLLPTELHDAARVDGARPGQELWHIILPLAAPAHLRTIFAVAVLSLGELGAGKLVETPGSQTFAHEIFTQMHYGVTNDLAALCLVLLTVVLLGGVLFSFPHRARSFLSHLARWRLPRS
jgi:iron(III) transport system permease protein